MVIMEGMATMAGIATVLNPAILKQSQIKRKANLPQNKSGVGGEDGLPDFL